MKLAALTAPLLAMLLLAVASIIPGAHARGYGSLICEGQAHQTFTGGKGSDFLVPCSGTGASGGATCSFQALGFSSSFADWFNFKFTYAAQVTCQVPAQAALCVFACNGNTCTTQVVKTCPPGEEAVAVALNDGNGRRSLAAALNPPPPQLPQAAGGGDGADARDLSTTECVLDASCCDYSNGILMYGVRCGDTCSNPCNCGS